MSNELMIKTSILNRIWSKLKRQKTTLETNTELYNFLKERYSEEKRIIGIIPVRVFGQEQLDKITGLDISREDYIKSLKGIEELRNLQELYCRLGVVFDYDSICEALSNEGLQAKRLSIKSPEQLDGYDLTRLPIDVELLGYDMTKKYERNNGIIIEKKEDVKNRVTQITGVNINTISYKDSLIEPERQEEYDYIMRMKKKLTNGELSLEDVRQLADIALGKDTDDKDKKSWELEPEEKVKIQHEILQTAQEHCEQEMPIDTQKIQRDKEER